MMRCIMVHVCKRVSVQKIVIRFKLESPVLHTCFEVLQVQSELKHSYVQVGSWLAGTLRLIICTVRNTHSAVSS
jgi:hypothetical protein